MPHPQRAKGLTRREKAGQVLSILTVDPADRVLQDLWEWTPKRLGSWGLDGPTLGHTVVPAQAEKGLGSSENELRPSEAQNEKGPQAGTGWAKPGLSSVRPRVAHGRPAASGWGHIWVLLSGPPQG